MGQRGLAVVTYSWWQTPRQQRNKKVGTWTRRAPSAREARRSPRFVGNLRNPVDSPQTWRALFLAAWPIAPSPTTALAPVRPPPARSSGLGRTLPALPERNPEATPPCTPGLLCAPANLRLHSWMRAIHNPAWSLLVGGSVRRRRAVPFPLAPCGALSALSALCLSLTSLSLSLRLSLGAQSSLPSRRPSRPSWSGSANGSSRDRRRGPNVST
jgi:hypothetical protein